MSRFSSSLSTVHNFFVFDDPHHSNDIHGSSACQTMMLLDYVENPFVELCLNFKDFRKFELNLLNAFLRVADLVFDFFDQFVVQE